MLSVVFLLLEVLSKFMIALTPMGFVILCQPSTVYTEHGKGIYSDKTGIKLAYLVSYNFYHE